MTTCTIGQECITEVMSLIEVNPQPFILEEDPIPLCDGKALCEVVMNTLPGEEFGPPMPPLEFFIGREELLAFMFNGSTIPDPSTIPLSASAFFLIAGLLTLVFHKRIFS